MNINKIEISKEIGEENTELQNELSILRKGDDPYDRDVWSRPIKIPDWKKIIGLCEESLKNSRNIIIASRLSEALVHTYGLSGLRASVDIFLEILENDDYYPKSEARRDLVFHWINSKLPFLLYEHFNLLNIQEYSLDYLEKSQAVLNEIIEKTPKLKFHSQNILDTAQIISKQISIMINNFNNNSSSISENNTHKQSELIETIHNIIRTNSVDNLDGLIQLLQRHIK